MSPKGKSNRSEWQECINCKVILSEKDLDVHNEVCEELFDHIQSVNNDSNLNYSSFLSETLKCVNHGFFLERNAFVYHMEINLKGDEIKSLPGSCQKRLVLLHPSLMRFCGFGIGECLFIMGNSFELLALAWPYSGLRTMSVHILGDRVVQKQILMITPYTKSLQDALEIELSCSERDGNDANFLKQLLIQNENKYILPGSELLCNFFGIVKTVHITSILGTDNIRYAKELCQTTQTCDENLIGMVQSMQITPRKTLRNIQMSPKVTPQNFTPTKLVALKEQPKNLNAEINLKQYFVLKTDCKVKLKRIESQDKKLSKGLKFSDIGGLDTELKTLRNTMAVFFSKAHMVKNYGVSPPKGILLFGTSGTGKTMIGKAIASEEKDLNVFSLNIQNVFSRFYGETEVLIKEQFDKAIELAPSIILIDEIDILCSTNDSQSTDQEKRITSAVISCIDSLKDKQVMLVAITNKIESLSPALRRPGRIDKEIEIGIPNTEGRFDILNKQLSHIPNTLTLDEVRTIVSNAHGFTGADLGAALREAGNLASLTSTVELAQITYGNLLEAIKQIRPSGMKEVCIEVPKVLWSDIGGMKEVKHKLVQAIEWPLKHPEAFQRLGIKPPRGLLMYGPPGCSKTMIAKALATESGLNFLAIKGPELFNKWVGESERAVRSLFRRAKSVAPSVIFFDEIDALAGERASSNKGSNVGNRVLAQLLAEMDGIERLEGVTIIAATNRPDMIDQALLRPGRLDSIVYVPLPDEETRREILEIQFRKMPIREDVSVEELVHKTIGYSGAEIVAVCQEAGMAALTESLETESISKSHFEQALKFVQPRTPKETIEFYETYYKKKR